MIMMASGDELVTLLATLEGRYSRNGCSFSKIYDDEYLRYRYSNGYISGNYDFRYDRKLGYGLRVPCKSDSYYWVNDLSKFKQFIVEFFGDVALKPYTDTKYKQKMDELVCKYNLIVQ